MHHLSSISSRNRCILPSVPKECNRQSSNHQENNGAANDDGSNLKAGDTPYLTI
jgi:hypothetical protein